MKKRIIVLLFLAVFSLSLLGYFFTQEERTPYSLSLTAAAKELDNALCERLPIAPFRATIDGVACTVTSIKRIPHLYQDAKSGQAFRSALFSDLVFEITLSAERRDGVYYSGEHYLSCGKSAALSSEKFETNVVFWRLTGA